MIGPAPAHLVDGLTALLRGTPVRWSTLGVTSAELVDTCAEQDLIGLLQQRLTGLPADTDWPRNVREELAQEARAEVARELARRKETISVLDALGAEGIHPILLKGTALAYTLYDRPASRPRRDTDLFVPREGVDAARRAMPRLGYTATTYCDGELLFCQFEVGKEDAFGLRHAFDVHWKISTQAVFADVLSYEEIAADAVPVRALGEHARAAGPVHALLLACIHPVMHHRNEERLIWLYDVHLLASQLSASEFERFTDLAIAREVAAICAHELMLAGGRFGTDVGKGIARLALAHKAEPSALYLQPERRWHDELISSVRRLPQWRDRLQLVREVLFPSPRYMLAAYGVTDTPHHVALLPALYVHRMVHGAWKILVGRK